MWSDNETSRDFVNFTAVANTAAEMVIQAKGRPLSIGVSGSWGVGKSSLIKLIQGSLENRATETGDQFLFVEFNAWLYQGYDDARAALMDVIARRLLEHAEGNDSWTEKAQDLLARVNWARAAGLVGAVGASVALGFPVPGVVGSVWGAMKSLTDGQITAGDVTEAKEAAKAAAGTGKGLFKPAPDTTPPKEIQELRNHFAETLKEMGVTLVVLIDDLDRCLPATAIATLEAIRLFLFLPHTAFIIAADDKMIRQAVRVHFKDVPLDDDLLTNYFDKLVQIPIRVPPLGTQEVRAYLLLLFIENSSLQEDQQEQVREAVCKQLSETWQGKRVDAAFVKKLITNCPADLTGKLELADRLAPLMTVSKQIAGNPRLIKRFLNTLFIRLTMAKAQSVNVDEAVLAKLLLFERCGSEEAYRQLIKAVNENEEGKPIFLQDWEGSAQKGEEFQSASPWDGEFAKSWLALEPAFAEQDLRAAVYISRDHLPVILAADQLSADGAEILEALLSVQSQSNPLSERIKGLSNRDGAFIAERILQRARQANSWGTPPILYAGLTMAAAGKDYAARFAQFLSDLPSAQITTAIIPLLADKTWAAPVLAKWETDTATSSQVKRAIKASKKER